MNNSNDQLIKSAKLGDLDGVKQALKDGAYVNAYGEEALHLAAYNGHLDVIK